MSDYISREAAIHAANRADDRGLSLEDANKMSAAVVAEIEKLPAAEVKPVARGKWLTWEEQFPGRKPPRKSGLGVFCSNPDCRKHADNLTDYCPNCGADMRGKDGANG